VSVNTSIRVSRGGRSAGGIVLLTFGIMFFFLGLLLGSLCFIAGGILCEGTIIGQMAFAFLTLGAIPLVLGIALLAISGRRRRALEAQGGAAATDAVAQSMISAAFSAPRLSPAAEPASTEPVALNCPECGAPVERGAPVCTYCGQTFA